MDEPSGGSVDGYGWRGVESVPPQAFSPLWRPSMTAILLVIARYYDVSPQLIRGPGRARALTAPRQHFMHIARTAGYTLPQIGRYLGKDHTTVLYGVRAHAARPKKGRNDGVWVRYFLDSCAEDDAPALGGHGEHRGAVEEGRPAAW